MDAALIEWKHENEKLRYVVPETKRIYHPDFSITETPSLIVEAKGIFSASDRKKMLLVKEQHPTREILMVFGRAKNPIRKGSKTTYADWCDKNEIRWIDLNDFVKDPRACLLSSAKKKKSGKSPTSVPKKSRRSSKSGKRLSSTGLVGT
jgi:hypothetical protein